MSNSKLVNKTIKASSKNYTAGRRGNKIKKITIHHMAGVMSIEQCGKLFQNPARQVSSHYGIGNDGRIGLFVEEKNIAWTDGNWGSNCTSVTIETSNSKRGGNWPVSDKALNSLIRLVADIAKRNGLGTLVKGKNVTWHSMYASTSCPGNYLRSKMDYIVAQANKINSAKPAPKPSGKLNLTRLLKRGSTGTAVKNLQKALGGLTADGIFGPATEAKVKAFQKKNKLTADGIVGKDTAHKLGWLWCGK